MKSLGIMTAALLEQRLFCAGSIALVAALGASAASAQAPRTHNFEYSFAGGSYTLNNVILTATETSFNSGIWQVVNASGSITSPGLGASTITGVGPTNLNGRFVSNSFYFPANAVAARGGAGASLHFDFHADGPHNGFTLSTSATTGFWVTNSNSGDSIEEYTGSGTSLSNSRLGATTIAAVPLPAAGGLLSAVGLFAVACVAFWRRRRTRTNAA